VQPFSAADPKPFRGSVDARENLRIEVEGDLGHARFIVLQRERGFHRSCWRDGFGRPRRWEAIIRGPDANDGKELRKAHGHLGQLVLADSSAGVTPITPGMREAPECDGSRPRPMLFLCHRWPFFTSAVRTSGSSMNAPPPA
jgi:hypothetical protein